MTDNSNYNNLLEESYTTLKWLIEYLDEQYESVYDEGECERYYEYVSSNVEKYIRPVMEKLKVLDERNTNYKSSIKFPDPYELANR